MLLLELGCKLRYGAGTMGIPVGYLRGGSWNNNRTNVQAARRNRNEPNDRNNNNGFRPARSLSMMEEHQGKQSGRLSGPESGVLCSRVSSCHTGCVLRVSAGDPRLAVYIDLPGKYRKAWLPGSG